MPLNQNPPAKPWRITEIVDRGAVHHHDRFHVRGENLYHDPPESIAWCVTRFDDERYDVSGAIRRDQISGGP